MPRECWEESRSSHGVEGCRWGLLSAFPTSKKRRFRLTRARARSRVYRVRAIFVASRSVHGYRTAMTNLFSACDPLECSFARCAESARPSRGSRETLERSRLGI